MGKFRSLKRQIGNKRLSPGISQAVSAAKIYNANKDRSMFGDLSDSGKRGINEIVPYYVGEVFRMLQDEDIIDSRADIEKCDTINYYLAVGSELRGRAADIPATIPNSKGVKESRNNWFLLIPPLKEAVLRINRRRYMKYKIEEINEEERSVNCSIMDYSFDGAWLCETWLERCKAFISADGSVAIEVNGLLLDDIVKIDNLVPWNEADKTIMQKVVVPYLERVAPKEDELTRRGVSFYQAIAETNYWLMQGKPKAKRGGKNTVEGVCDETGDKQKPQIIRTLVGGMTIESNKIPRVANAETVRHYKVAAWNTRGHTRTLKSGKVIYIRQSVHHRKNMNGVVAKTIIQMETKTV